MNSLLKDVTIPFVQNGNKEQDDKILQPYVHIMQIPSKSIRVEIVKMVNYWLKVPEDIIEEIAEVLALVHHASLLIDDIQDSSNLRRGLPSAHIIYGIPTTLNAASYLLFIALQSGYNLLCSKGMSMEMEHVLEAHRGQGMELYHRENFICPTEEEYCQIAIRKTGSFFTAGIRLVQVSSENKYDFSNLSSRLGLYFQIRDDYLNLYSKDFQDFKGFCEDISEGKFSFPIIHGINSDPDGELLEILKKRTTDVELKKRFVFLLEKYGSFEYTRNKLQDVREQMLKEVDELGGNPYIIYLVDQVLTMRKY